MIACAALALVLPPLIATTTHAADRPPNVIVVLTDDQGYGDVGIHGNDKINTPHLDKFAGEGVQFSRFYVSPVCAPTRASLLTGRYYYRSGVIHTSRGAAKMHGDELTLAEMLQAAGYATGIFGKWHLGDNYPMRPQDQGFSEALVHKSGGITQAPDQPSSYFAPVLWQNGRRIKAEGYCTDVFFSAAMQFIEENRARPFFVYLPTNAPHTPLQISDQYAQPYLDKGLDETTAKVYGMVENIDDNMGRLLTRLDELELRDNTLLIFFCDNGPQQSRYTAGLRGRKSMTYEGGIRAPCFVQWPARLKGQRTIDRIAAHFDLAPTILAACGIDAPTERPFDGVSLLPLLDGNANNWPERTLYFQCHRGLTPKKYQNCAAVTQRYKLVGNPGTFGREDFDDGGNPVLELYDLSSDPGEENDLAEQSPDIVAQLRDAYANWFADVQSSRQFQPGVIQLGARQENPSHLCRYQDGAFVGNQSQGWTVDIVRGGRYEMTINRGGDDSPAELHVDWQGEHITAPLDSNNRATVRLSAGRGVLDIWAQPTGKPRPVIGDNSTLGDVELRRHGE